MNLNKILFIGAILVVAVGFFYFGLVVGTYMAIDRITALGSGILSGTTINIDLNETQIVSEFNKTIYPRMMEYMGEIG